MLEAKYKQSGSGCRKLGVGSGEWGDKETRGQGEEGTRKDQILPAPPRLVPLSPCLLVPYDYGYSGTKFFQERFLGDQGYVLRSL